MSKKEQMIPWTRDGGIPHWLHMDGCYAWDGSNRLYAEMRPAEDFHAVLQLDRITSGRSAVTCWWKNVFNEKACFPMVQAEMNRLIKKAEWQGPLIIDGRWRPLKRGANYQIKAVLTEDL